LRTSASASASTTAPLSLVMTSCGAPLSMIASR
jgi:hypothetical protein